MTTPETIGMGGEPAEKKPSMVITLAVVAVLSLVASGGGWLLGGSIAPATETGSEAGEGAPAEDAAGEVDEPAVPADIAIVNLEPITTNLAYPAENWVRLELALVFEGVADKALARTIHQDILAYLRTVSLQQIEGPRGFQHLKNDLLERARLRSDGKVTGVLFRTFVIE